MTRQVIIKPHKDHVHHRTALLRLYRKERGEDKTPDGYRVPRTLNRDIAQLTRWWHAEYRRARSQKPWHRDSDQRLWEQAKARIDRSLQNADPEAIYADNTWFWNKALLKLAIYLEVLKTTPSPTQLFIESLKETITDRISDTGKLIDNAGEAVGGLADTLSDTSERVLSGLKVAAIVGTSLIGAAIVLPPVIRAVRAKPEQTHP